MLDCWLSKLAAQLSPVLTVLAGVFDRGARRLSRLRGGSA
jgi:hypothetical protein